MSRAVRCGWIVLVLVLPGCTRDEEYLEVARDQRAAWKEMADLLATVKDEKSMAAAKSILEERRPKYEAIAKRAKSLPKPSAEVLSRLEEDKFLVQASIRRLAVESERVSKLEPGGKEFMEQFRSHSQGLMSAVQR